MRVQLFCDLTSRSCATQPHIPSFHIMCCCCCSSCSCHSCAAVLQMAVERPQQTRTQCVLSATRPPCATLHQVLARALRWRCSVDVSLEGYQVAAQRYGTVANTWRAPARSTTAHIDVCCKYKWVSEGARAQGSHAWRRIDGRECPPWRQSPA